MSTDNEIMDYETFEGYINFEIFEDPYNVIYKADINQDGEPDYKQVIDVDKDGIIDITKFGIEGNESDIIWYRVIQDYEMVEERVNEPSEDTFQTEWFDISLDLLNSTGALNTLNTEAFPYSDYWGKRFRSELLETSEYLRNRYFSVTFDEDFDGFADTQVVYEKEEYVIDTKVKVIDTTIIGTIGLTHINELDYYGIPYDPNDLVSLNRFMLTFFDKSSFENDEEVFLLRYVGGMSQASGESLIDDDTSYSERLLILKESCQKVVEETEIIYTNSFMSEAITFIDLHLGEFVEARTYKDKYIDDASYYNLEEPLTTLTINDNDFEQEQEVEVVDPFIITDISQIDWQTSTWGSDNIPGKYDSLTIQHDDSTTVENKYDSIVLIRIPMRYSLYNDYLDDSFSSNLDEGSTVFRVEGVLMTPESGVYYTSDKESFMSSATHDAAKVDGHYLFFDSNENEFQETVFILAPDEDEDGIYEVISIGYNYDGVGDFIPYKTVDMSSDLFGSSFFSYNIDFFNDASSASTSVKDSYNLQVLDLQFLALFESLYPKDLFDGYAAKDHIFEISKLVRASEYDDMYPELYDQVWRKEYGEALNVYKNNLYQDVLSQVQMSVIAGIASATVMAYGGTAGAILSPFVFAAVYFTLSWTMQILQKQEMERVSARSYFSEEPSTRTSINNKIEGDLYRGGLEEATSDHSSAYYTNVYGEGEDYLYDAQVMVAPPANWRSDEYITYEPPEWYENIEFTGYTLYDAFNDLNSGFTLSKCFTNYNLDYFSINSGLMAIGDQEYYDVNIGVDNDRKVLYDTYRWNTIESLEALVSTESNGQFDIIRPYCINGVPQYIFVSSQDAQVENTLPASHLYQPVIIGNERYVELSKAGLIYDSVIKIRIDCAYSTIHDNAVNSYELDPSEAEIYKSKVPLTFKEFNYPISNIIITYGIQDEAPLIIREVNPSDYTIIDGILYFYRTLEKIVFTTLSEKQLTTDPDNKENADYDIYIIFPTTIPISASYVFGDDSQMNNLPSGDAQQLQQPYIDATTEGEGRIALSQSCSYAISDYFAQYWMAAEDGQNRAELDYTVMVTFWSTLISSLILVPLTATMAGAHAGSSAAFTSAMIKGSIAIPAGVATEIFEELYVDPVIERWVTQLVYKSGGSDELANFWSMFACSFREAFGGVSNVVQASKADSQISIDATKNTQEKLKQARSTISISSKVKTGLAKAMAYTTKGMSIGFNMIGIFMGGAGPGILALGLDKTTEQIGDIVIEKYKKHLSMKLQDQVRRDILELMKKEIPDLKGITIDKNARLFGITPQNTPTPPILLIETSFLASQSHIEQVQILESLNIISPLEAKYAEIKENVQNLENLKVNSESDSNEIFIQMARKKGEGTIIVFLEGLSMYPLFKPGSLIPVKIMRTDAEYEVGDIVLFNRNGIYVVHEIAYKYTDTEGTVRYTTRGLNHETNPRVDTGVLSGDQILGIADLSEDFLAGIPALESQGLLFEMKAYGMENQFDTLLQRANKVYEKLVNVDQSNKEAVLDALVEYMEVLFEFKKSNIDHLDISNKFIQATIEADLVACYLCIENDIFTGYSSILFKQMFSRLVGRGFNIHNPNDIRLNIDEFKILTEIIRCSSNLDSIDTLIRDLNTKVFSFRFKDRTIKANYLNDLINEIWGIDNYDRLLFLNLQADFEGIIYGPYTDKSFFKSGKLRQLVYNKKFSNTEDLLIKLKQFLEIDLSEDINSNFLNVFAKCRELWGSTQWPTSVGGHNPASIFQFDLEFRENNDDNSRYRSGYYFSIFGEQIMDIDPNKNIEDLYPIIGNEWHAERKAVIALEDKMSLNNLIRGEIKIYCENSICFGCLDNVVRLFKRCNQHGGRLKIIIYHAIQFDMNPDNGLPNPIILDPNEFENNPNCYDQYLM